MIGGIKDKRVIQAFNQVRREEFVSKEYKLEATGDYPLPIGEGQTISQPSLVAQMTELLRLRGKEKVLEIGTGSGYQAAILGKLAKKVITVERIPSLAQTARETLKRLGFKNVTVIIGDGKLGWPEQAPYDAIMVTAAGRGIPQPLIDQLKDGGRMVIPVVGDGQELILGVKKGKDLETTRIEPVVFVPLV